MSPCVFLRCLAKWLRLCLFSTFLVGAASLLWSGWPRSFRIFSVWVRTLNVLRSYLFHLLDKRFYCTNNGSQCNSLHFVQLALVSFWSGDPGGCGISHDETDCSCVDPSQDVCVRENCWSTCTFDPALLLTAVFFFPHLVECLWQVETDSQQLSLLIEGVFSVLSKGCKLIFTAARGWICCWSPGTRWDDG